MAPIMASGFLSDPILPVRGINIENVVNIWYINNTLGIIRLNKYINCHLRTRTSVNGCIINNRYLNLYLSHLVVDNLRFFMIDSIN